MHDWRRNSNKIGGGRNGGRISGGLCWWWKRSRLGPFTSFLLDYFGRGRGSTGGLSLNESPPWGDAAGRVGTLAAFLLLKDTPPSESSSSERISNTLFPLSRGARAGDEATTSGIAAVGGGELGV